MKSVDRSKFSSNDQSLNGDDEAASHGGEPSNGQQPLREEALGLEGMKPEAAKVVSIVSKSDERDPFDPKNLRLDQDYVAAVAVTKPIITINVRRPDKHVFFRVHPDASYTLDASVVEIKDEGEVYVVIPEIASAVPHEVVPKRIFTILTRQNVLGLWPVRLPGEDGKLDTWNRSALTIADIATKKWVRMVSNRSLGAYEPMIAAVEMTAPAWPAMSFKDVLRIAFRDKIIDTIDHPVLRRLRGEI